MTETAFDNHDDDLVAVRLPSGATFKVYKLEVEHFKERSEKYLEHNKLTNVADLSTMDQILQMELLVWRWNTWLSQQKDYWGDPIDEALFTKQAGDMSRELRQLKASLGIDKVSRDKARGEDSVYNYLMNIRARAKEFGVMREKQLDKALELFNELKAVLTLMDNCTPDEQQEIHCTPEDVFKWIREQAIPEFDAIDRHFQENSQRYWIQEQ